MWKAQEVPRFGKAQYSVFNSGKTEPLENLLLGEKCSMDCLSNLLHALSR